MEDALKTAKQMKMKKVHLDASEYAKEFYLHLGFTQYEKKRVVMGIIMIPFQIKIS